MHEIRVIILGNGDAGKTSLVNVLTGKKVLENDKSTWGVNRQIKSYQDLKVHFWDFGGQSIMHSTHKFFLSSRCVYVVVLNGRADENTSRWLEHIKVHGGSSPTFIVVNKIDQCPNADVNLFRLRKRYDFIENSFRISCNEPNKHQMHDFEKELIKHIKKTDTYCSLIPLSWKKIKNRLETIKDYITIQVFYDMCKVEGIFESDANELLEILYYLGVIHYFKGINQTHIFTTEWITNVLYEIIVYDTYDCNEIGFSFTTIQSILNELNKNYGQFTNYIITLMCELKLCYRDSINDQIVIPCKLKDNLPKEREEFNDIYLTSIRYVYDYLDINILHKFITTEFIYIHNNLVWKDGVILNFKDNGCAALIEIDLFKKYINVKIKPYTQNPKIKDTLKAIIDSLKKINIATYKDYDGEIYKILVPIITDVNETEIKNWVNIEDLENLKKYEEYYINPRPYKKFDINKLLGISNEKLNNNKELEEVKNNQENTTYIETQYNIGGKIDRSQLGGKKSTLTMSSYYGNNKELTKLLKDLEESLQTSKLHQKKVQEIQDVVEDLKEIKDINNLQQDKKDRFKRRLEKFLEIGGNIASIVGAITPFFI